MSERAVARLGWRPDLPDHRDSLFHHHHRVLDGGQLPAKVDLRPHMPPIVNQGHLGSCTGNGIARILAYEALRQGEPLHVSPDNAGYSRLFIYYGEREIEGTTDQDCGAQIRDGIKVVARDGAPPEAIWPYSDANPGPAFDRPPGEVYAEAADHKAIVYHRVVPGSRGAPIRSALAAGLPIVFGFSVPAYFMNGTWDAATEILPLPGRNEQIVGGHCVVAVGYDFTGPQPHLIISNSWGSSWGDGGHFRMDAGYFDPRTGLATDLWTVSRVE